MNPVNAPKDSETAAVSVVCLFSGRAGHTKRSHCDCRMNAAATAVPRMPLISPDMLRMEERAIQEEPIAIDL